MAGAMERNGFESQWKLGGMKSKNQSKNKKTGLLYIIKNFLGENATNQDVISQSSALIEEAIRIRNRK